MTLSAGQIKEWSQRGDPIHAWYSYEMVRGSLVDGRLEGTWSVYPQGSYANKTNIAADSDVDLVVALTSSFYPDKGKLSLIEEVEYGKYYEQADRTWQHFHDAVTRILRQDFWVEEGSKAVKVRSGLIRLPADVLIALEHRYYQSFPSFEGQVFVDGVQFYRSGNAQDRQLPQAAHGSLRVEERPDRGELPEGGPRGQERAERAHRGGRGGSTRRRRPTSWSPCCGTFLNLSFAQRPAERVPASDLSGWMGMQDELGTMKFPNGRGELFENTSDTSWNQDSAKQIIIGLRGYVRRSDRRAWPAWPGWEAEAPSAQRVTHRVDAPAPRGVDLVPLVGDGQVEVLRPSAPSASARLPSSASPLAPSWRAPIPHRARPRWAPRSTARPGGTRSGTGSG